MSLTYSSPEPYFPSPAPVFPPRQPSIPPANAAKRLRHSTSSQRLRHSHSYSQISYPVARSGDGNHLDDAADPLNRASSRSLPTPRPERASDLRHPSSSRSSKSLPPHPPTRSHSLTAKALALTAKAGGVGGLQRELRAKLPAGVSSSGSGKYEEEHAVRRYTDPGCHSGGVELTGDVVVDGLISASVVALQSIWGLTDADGSILPLDFFVREIIRRSRTATSTLQLALYYLHKGRHEFRARIAKAAEKPAAASLALTSEQQEAYPTPPTSPTDSMTPVLDLAATAPLLDGRKMFLCALLVASKFLCDRNYSNGAWARISGLPLKEVNDNERMFLCLLEYDLSFGVEDFTRWTERLAALGTVRPERVTLATSPRLSDEPQRIGLARHSSEYPAAPPLGEMRSADPHVPAGQALPRPTPPQLGGRSRSHPNVGTPRASVLLPSHPSHLRKQISSEESWSGLPSPPLTDTSSSPSRAPSSDSDEESMSRRQIVRPKASRLRLPSQPLWIQQAREACGVDVAMAAPRVAAH